MKKLDDFLQDPRGKTRGNRGINERIHLDTIEHRIVFTDEPKNVRIDEVPPDTFLIYHEMYDPPKIKGVKNISYLDYRAGYIDLHANMFILVGLNRMSTPSSRCDFALEYLSVMTTNIPKVSIDTTPFIGEPWRLFFHYQFTHNNTFNMPHSYAVQTEWQHWFYRDIRDCLISPENIGPYITKTISTLRPLTTSFAFSDATANDEEWYLEAKKFIFKKYHTPKSLINFLLKLSNEHFKLELDYNSYLTNRSFLLPDLGVYRFMVEENIRRMQIYNKIINIGGREREKA